MFPELPIAFITWENKQWVAYCYSCCIPNPPNRCLSPMHLKDFKGYKQNCAKCQAVIAKPILPNFFKENPKYSRYQNQFMHEWSAIASHPNSRYML